MARFFAMTSRGLLDVLVSEIQELGLKGVERTPGGVFFTGNWADCYRANLQLRTATRVVLPVLDFFAYKPEDLYFNAKKHDFTKYIHPEQTLAVDASVRDSHFTDQRFVALKLKDAIVDQFREKFGVRPNVDVKNADLRIYVRVVKSEVSVSVDTSGQSLAFRGYRKETVEAPLREHLAAGLLRLSNWDRKMPVVDLMCGSGTILIEAALMALKIPPGSLRHRFGFQGLKNFDEEAWQKVLDEELEGELEELPFEFYGFDISPRAVAASKANAKAAGVSDFVRFQRQAVDLVKAPCETGVIIINPPYGERLNDPESAKDIYRDLAFTLKNSFKGWSCWLLSGNEELTAALKLKAKRKIPLMNGPLDCRFLEYEIR